MKKNNLAGCCGISCGLCPRFQSKAKSKCLGCGPDGHCSYCSIFRCCVLKRNYETCADCSEFPCNKFDKWFDSDSFVTHYKCFSNIKNIKKLGFKKFFEEQEERKKLLEMILEKYNPGRCTSLYCQACALMNMESLQEAVAKIEIVKQDKAKLFKNLIQELAEKEKLNLKLRK
jgi:hypothetical protein